MSEAAGQLTLTELTPEAEPPAPPVAATEPTAEQRAAIAARERDAFLEAGAGSGKTRVLVDRYCAAVAEDDIDVDRILAFTFTERAAAEMRTRVRRELVARARAAADAGDEDSADVLRRAARATERAWVLTIHAFCRRLLATHPLAAGLDPRFRVLDAAEAARLADRAAREALEELLASGDDDVARAAAAYTPRRLVPMVLEAHTRLRSQGMADPRLPDVPDPVHSPGRGEEQRALTPEELERARSARRALELLLERFHARYEALKDERSALDFQDLELRALNLLESSPGLASAWRERFVHVMVDEFQDTNSVQLRLIGMLSGSETRTFMVGDEHQSIYRFRNADLEVFRAERRAALESPDRDVLPLRGNFRSLPAVLATVNQVGRTLLEGFTELTVGRPAADGPGSAELLLTLDEGTGRDARRWAQDEIDLEPPPVASAPKVIAEARFLAQRLRELVDNEGVERGQIVVLLRAFTHVDAYEEALTRAGLRPFVVGGRGYWTQQQVEDLIRLLGVVSNPLDDEYLFGALASFSNAVSPDALWLLRRAATSEDGYARRVWPVIEWRYGGGREPADHADRWLEAIDAEDAARLERFCSVLAGLRAETPRLTLEELIERTMSAFGYDLGLIAREGGAGRMANVRKLMRLARDYEANEGRDLAGFLALAAESTQRDEREGMAAVQAEEHDGVRVMTVHAAKGLEFDVVAVPDLGRKLDAGHSAADITIGRPDDEGSRRFGMRLVFPARKQFGVWELADLNTAEGEAAAEEGCRLVYVAASRARDRLILSGIFKPADLEPAEQLKPSDTPLRRLLPALAERGFAGADDEVELPAPQPVGGGEPDPPTTRLAISVSEPGERRAAQLVRSFPPPAEDGPFASIDGPPPLLDHGPAPVPVGHLSYSALALYEQCGYRFYVERVLGAREALAPAPGEPADEAPEVPGELPEPGTVRGHALGIGNAVHGALEWSAAHDWGTPGDDLIARLLAREGLAGDAGALARARRLVAGWLDSGLRAELSGPLRPEVPFTLPLGGTIIRGKIDLLADDGEGGLPTVVDYKTDALDGRSPADAAARYAAQRQVYALAVGGDTGARAVHLFLEAPNDPLVEIFDAEGLRAAREHLSELIGRMRGGKFQVTESPYPALCFGCPAAARLCPRPAWKPSGG